MIPSFKEGEGGGHRRVRSPFAGRRSLDNNKTGLTAVRSRQGCSEADMENYLDGNLYHNTASYYDHDTRDIIRDDLDFYAEYAEQTKGPILELASGTGRVSLYIAEKTGRRIDCVELSDSMIERFRNKLKKFPENVQKNVHIHKGDMSKFDLPSKYEYVIIPWRSLQILPLREQTADCLKCVREHMSDNGIFVFDIFKPGIYDDWAGMESITYDIIHEGKRIIRSTVNHFADTDKKYIRYKNRIRIIDNGEETVKEDMLTLKYYEHDDIVKILEEQKFKIREEFGYYDKRSIADGDEMIFVCTK
jgi:SAM-dependent methyltransferase